MSKNTVEFGAIRWVKVCLAGNVIAEVEADRIAIEAKEIAGVLECYYVFTSNLHPNGEFRVAQVIGWYMC